MKLRIYDVAIDVVREVQPIIERVAKRDPNLADHLRRSVTSVPLNLLEGAYVQGGNTRARFHTALGSAAEVRTCLDLAEALGYVKSVDAGLRDKVDRIIATVTRLARR